MTQAVIVAAGGGSRLYPVTDLFPKIMLPIGQTQVPVLEKIISHCIEHNIDDLVFCLNAPRGFQVLNYLKGKDYEKIRKIQFSFTDLPQGTAGEIKIAWDKGYIKDDKVIIYYGDTLCNTNLTEMMIFHDGRDGDVSVVVNDTIRIPVGYVEDAGGHICLIKEKPTLAELGKGKSIKIGGILPIFYVTNKDFFEKCEIGLDIVNDVIQDMLKLEYRIMAYHDQKPFIDIGNWKNYYLANTEWK